MTPPSPTIQTSVADAPHTADRFCVGAGPLIEAAVQTRPSECSTVPPMPTAQTSVELDAHTPYSVGALLGSSASVHKPCTKCDAIPRDAIAPTTQTSLSPIGHTPLSVAAVGKGGLAGTHWPAFGRASWLPASKTLPPSLPASTPASPPGT